MDDDGDAPTVEEERWWLVAFQGRLRVRRRRCGGVAMCNTPWKGGWLLGPSLGTDWGGLTGGRRHEVVGSSRCPDNLSSDMNYMCEAVEISLGNFFSVSYAHSMVGAGATCPRRRNSRNDLKVGMTAEKNAYSALVSYGWFVVSGGAEVQRYAVAGSTSEISLQCGLIVRRVWRRYYIVAMDYLSACTLAPQRRLLRT